MIDMTFTLRRRALPHYEEGAELRRELARWLFGAKMAEMIRAAPGFTAYQCLTRRFCSDAKMKRYAMMRRSLR